jgi:hypothetical protein
MTRTSCRCRRPRRGCSTRSDKSRTSSGRTRWAPALPPLLALLFRWWLPPGFPLRSCPLSPPLRCTTGRAITVPPAHVTHRLSPLTLPLPWPPPSALSLVRAQVLSQRFSKVQGERDELYTKFEASIYDVQQKTGLKSQLLEKKIEVGILDWAGQAVDCSVVIEIPPRDTGC